MSQSNNLSPNTAPISPQQQLKRRRIQKIKARSQIVAQQSISSALSDTPSRQFSKQDNMTAYQMFKSSKKYQSYKFYLEIFGILLGLICAIVHVLFVDRSQAVFGIVFGFVTISAIFIQGKRMTKVSKFASNSGIDNDPLLSKVTNMKQLSIVNKILAIQASISPITKFLASFFLSILALGCVISK